jgi:3-hydroxy-9,10-secoandrosta-1,3,5(10)-triene-9,17-dione monooxygenase
MTPERLLQRAIALRDQLRDEKDEADERGAYSPALHQAFRQAGFSASPSPGCSADMNSTAAPTTV